MSDDIASKMKSKKTTRLRFSKNYINYTALDNKTIHDSFNDYII